MSDDRTLEQTLSELPMVGPEGYDPFWDSLEHRHYARTGERISFRTWCRLRIPSSEWGDLEYLRVGEDTIGDYWVSTVWVGLDHGLGFGSPLIFETMVFNRASGQSDLDCERYATEEEALAGHARKVDEVRLIVAATS